MKYHYTLHGKRYEIGEIGARSILRRLRTLADRSDPRVIAMERELQDQL